MDKLVYLENFIKEKTGAYRVSVMKDRIPTIGFVEIDVLFNPPDADKFIFACVMLHNQLFEESPLGVIASYILQKIIEQRDEYGE